MDYNSVTVDHLIDGVLESPEGIDFVRESGDRSGEDNEFDGGEIKELDRHFINLILLQDEFGFGRTLCTFHVPRIDPRGITLPPHDEAHEGHAP